MGTQKDIDKGIAAIEKLKSSLMPESYEALIEIYKKKQKDLNIEIMESAGGLGEMLGEGGRVGMQGGGWPGMLAWLAQQGPKVWKWMNKPGNNPIDLYKKYLKSVKDRAIKGDMKSLAPELGAITAGGIMANRWASKKLKEGLDLSEEEKKRKWWERGPGAYRPEKAEGGRVPMMYGGDPGFAFSYGGSWADWKDNHASEMPLMDYINQKLPKARHPFSDSKYNSGGPVHELDGLALSIFQKPYAQLTSSQQSTLDNFKPEPYEPIPKAKGGRIGLANGTTMDLKYINPGFDKSEGMLSGVGGFPLIPTATAGAGILALSQKDKDKKTPQKKEGPKLPEPKPPFKIGDLIIDFIVANSRQPKKSEEGQLKEIIRVAKEKAEGITSLFNENLHGINTQRFIESAQDTSQKLLEDLVDVEEYDWDPKTGKSTSTWKTYKRSDKDRPPTEEEIEDYMEDLHHGGELDWSDFGSTVAELDDAVEEAKSYEQYMMDQYKTGKLDKYMSMDAKLERVLDADSAGRPSGYSSDEEYEIRAYGDEKERVAIAKMNAEEEKAKAIASGSPWYTDPTTLTPEDELRKEFPGIDDNLIKNILADKDPANVAKVKEALTKALDMTMQGKKPEGIIKILKEQYPKKKAEGGRIGLEEGGTWGDTTTRDIVEQVILENKYRDPATKLPHDKLLELIKERISLYFLGGPKWIGSHLLGEGVGKTLIKRQGKRGLERRLAYAMDEADKRFKETGDYDERAQLFAKGGKTWRPKSAPKLTTTIPPERGPTPQGLTYLTGDDIVQNIG